MSSRPHLRWRSIRQGTLAGHEHQKNEILYRSRLSVANSKIFCQIRLGAEDIHAKARSRREWPAARSAGRLECEAGALADDIAKARRVDMRAGDRKVLARRHVENALAGLDREILVEIVGQRRVRVRNLDRRQMHHVAQRDEAVA